MSKAGFWKSDWFLGVLVSLAMLAGSGTDPIQSLERKVYDLGMLAASRTPSDRIAVIAIDDRSIANLGRWPWSRALHAKMTDLLAGAQAKVIANTIFFSEPQVDPGYAYIAQILDIIQGGSAEGTAPTPEMEKISALLQKAESELNTDRRLAESYGKAGTVLLPIFFQLGEAHGRPDKPLSASLAKNRIGKNFGKGVALQATAAQLPIEALANQALALGHLNAVPDSDGVVRSEPLVVQYFDGYYPSLALMIAAASLNLGAEDIRVQLGREVSLGNLRIATDSATRMNPFFYKNSEAQPAFQVDSFYDVLSGKIQAGKYAGKIVLIGGTAVGLGNLQVTPVSPAMEPVLALAHSVSSILQEHFFITPPWGPMASLSAFLLIGLYLSALLPRLSAGVGGFTTAALLAALLGTHFVLMMQNGTWIHLMGAASLLLVGHLLLTTKRFLAMERGKQRSDRESAESNRLLGLAFQGQGQLDMAFDKFRKCPMDDGLMVNLYNLALDYERKRQFNKAEAVFLYIADYKPDFRDLKQRIARANELSETLILGRPPVGGAMITGGGQVEKPMLGRYRIDKELGKGAMGVVYLGHDPKMNRVVAIKTMALSEQFEDGELQEVKTRFFREAETAGCLNHPNIITVHDVGEENDLAYIAMEFMQGRDLMFHTKPGKLLPLPKVLSIVIRVAEALDYAHANNVVHRDVKPANIMYESELDQVKVTDFGIARLSDSSRTRSGMVLGTPSYMSPEQLAGKRIDGRSDLFSLGVMLYQLCSGQLPFRGESIAQLMFNIANEPPTDIHTVNPAVPQAVVDVIGKAMSKDVQQRYQYGADMAADLRACQQALDGIPAEGAGGVQAPERKAQ